MSSHSPSPPAYWLVIPAAGVGSRMGAEYPKQYLKLLDKTIIEHTLDRFLSLQFIERIYIAVAEDDTYWPKLPHAHNPRIIVVDGGKERADSVLNCLEALSAFAREEDWVLVHDAARPCIGVQEIMKLVAELENHPVGGILGIPVTDTLKQVSNNTIEKTIDRTSLWQAQTPQMFRFGLLRSSLKLALRDGKKITDEASAMESYGYASLVVQGRSDNIKITRPEDLPIAAMLMQQQNISD